MLMAETLRRVIPDEHSDQVSGMICQEPHRDSTAVSLLDADPTQCQTPFSRVAPHCHDFCIRRMSVPITCNGSCRKWITMRDTVNQDLYSGFGSLVGYFVNRAATLARVTLLLPITSDLVGQLRRWQFAFEDPPEPLHDVWRTYSCPSASEDAITSRGGAPQGER